MQQHIQKAEVNLNSYSFYMVVKNGNTLVDSYIDIQLSKYSTTWCWYLSTVLFASIQSPQDTELIFDELEWQRTAHESAQHSHKPFRDI